MKLHTHILSTFDVKLVGPEAEVERYRRYVAELRELLDEVQWSGNIGQNGYGCPICNAGVYHRRGGDHAADCRLAAALRHGGDQ
jgi:hypothetical protein